MYGWDECGEERRGSAGNQTPDILWEHCVHVYEQRCEVGGWVLLPPSPSLTLCFSPPLPLCLSLSLGSFTSLYRANKSVRTFVVVMVTDIKR